MSTAGDWAWPVEWSARWIWIDPANGGAGNQLVYLRRRFWLDTVPQQAPARVTADSRFVLWVNATEVSRGPMRNIPERQAFHEVDLAKCLRQGWNVIGALVRRYRAPTGWWRPASPLGELGHAGFLFEAPAIGVVSDGSWRVRRAPWDENPSGHDVVREIIDGRGLEPRWLEDSHEEDVWHPAVELSAPPIGGMSSAPPGPPYSGMEAAGVAQLTQQRRPAVQVATGCTASTAGTDPASSYVSETCAETSGDRFLTFDVGEMTHATLALEIDAEEGTEVDLFVGEDVSPQGLAIIAPRHWVARYIAAGRDDECAETFDPVGFRYATAVIRGKGDVRNLEAVERRYPLTRDGEFRADDERLELIWRTGARTLELCATDAFIDCPGREQNAWVGDSYLHTLVCMTISNDWRLVRRNLRIGAHSRRPDGFLSAISAGGASLRSFNIPEYSSYWIRSLCRYVERSGDLERAVELLPTASQVVQAFERHREDDGLLRLPGIVFVDWAQTERGLSTAAVDALYAAALIDFARLCEWVGDQRRANLAREAYERSVAAFELYWDESRGVYVDALHGDQSQGRRVSQQTNALAIEAGLAPSDRWDRALDAVLDPTLVRKTLCNADLPEHQHWLYQSWEPQDFDSERDIVAAQPFMRHFLHQAVARAGRSEQVALLCLDWLAQLERGNTTFQEFWEAPAGAASRCHAWSSTPTYDLTTHVLGIRPVVESADDLGFRRVLVEPALGSLSFVSGSVPTPHGALKVEITRQGGHLYVPEGIRQVVVRHGGHELTVGAGEHDLSGHG